MPAEKMAPTFSTIRSLECQPPPPIVTLDTTDGLEEMAVTAFPDATFG